jgi:hypothetical protein
MAIKKSLPGKAPIAHSPAGMPKIKITKAPKKFR